MIAKSHPTRRRLDAPLRTIVTLAVLSAIGVFAGCGSSSHGSHLAYVAAGQDIFAYRLDNNSGAATAIIGSPFLTGVSPASVIVHPSNQFLYVANQGEDTISLFKIDSSSGALTEVTPRTTSHISPSAMTIDSGGKFLFVADQGSNDVTVFSIGSTGALAQISSASVGSSPAGLTLSNSGNLLFVPVLNFSAIYVFGVNAGVLSPMGSFVVTNGVSRLAIDPADKFLFVPNPATNTVTVLRQSGGVITSGPGSYSVGTTPVAAALDSSGTYLYVANFGSANVSQFQLDTSTGALTPLTTTTVAAGANPIFIVVDPAGKFIFVGNQGAGSISEFTVASKGGLTSTGNTIQVGATPRALSLTR